MPPTATPTTTHPTTTTNNTKPTPTSTTTTHHHPPPTSATQSVIFETINYGSFTVNGNAELQLLIIDAHYMYTTCTQYTTYTLHIHYMYAT